MIMRSFIKYLFSSLILITSASISFADILFKDINGQSTSFSSLKGKWVFINYWAGWCQTCLEEIPELNRFYHLHKEDPVVLFAVNFDSPPLFEQKNLTRKYRINYPSLLEDPARDLHLGDITGVPVTFIFNPKGKLVKTLYGGQTVETLNLVLANQ